MDRVLSLLIHKGGYVSGQEIAERERISRSAIWKHIKKARESGFIISSSPNRGYRIERYPENRIIPELIEYYYNGPLPYEIVYLETLPSTNTFAKELIIKGKKKQFILLAEDQLKGKGRYERSWISEKGKDLTFSIALTTGRPLNEFYRYTVISGLAVFKVLSSILKFNNISSAVRIKWPNDIMIDGRKICGILSEMITEEQRISSIIIGIGININSSPRFQNVISLRDAIRRDSDRNKLMSAIIKMFYDYSMKLENGCFDEVFKEWKRNVCWLNEMVSFNDGQSEVKGILKDIDANGSLIIKTDKGEKRYYSGDLASD
jgi:BirA family biotin operon repressor/biotin-[acetyl-CoA-carboxylase] ligase